MADKRVPLVTGEYYHIFNRGVARQPTFLTKHDYKQALLTLSYYRFVKPPIRLSRFKSLSQEQRNDIQNSLLKSIKHVEIISFVLMPNHFHCLLQQTADKGISIFLSQFTNSYTRYFNTKHDRVGPAYQGVFKAVRIESDEQLLYVNRYIHLNPIASAVVKENGLFAYPWSSLPDYIRGESSLIWMDPILGHFSSVDKYKEFILDQLDYAKTLEQIKHLVLETGRNLFSPSR